MKIYNMTNRELEELATQIKNKIIVWLVERGDLSQEQGDAYIKKFAIVYRNRSFWTKIFKRDEDDYVFVLVEKAE